MIWLVFAAGLLGGAATRAAGAVLYQRPKRLLVSVRLSRSRH